MQFWNFKKITLIIILISLITPQPSLKTQMNAFTTQSFSITYNFSSLEGCSVFKRNGSNFHLKLL